MFQCDELVERLVRQQAPVGPRGELREIEAPVQVRCATVFQSGTAGPDAPQCSCGTFAVGICKRCEHPVCGFHSGLVDGSRICGSCLQASTPMVFLQSAGPRKIMVIKAVRAFTGLGLREAKALVDAAPVELDFRLDHVLTRQLITELTNAGASVRVS